MYLDYFFFVSVLFLGILFRFLFPLWLTIDFTNFRRNSLQMAYCTVLTMSCTPASGIWLPSSPTLATYFSSFFSSASMGVHSLFMASPRTLLAVSRMEAPALGGFGAGYRSMSFLSPLLELSSLGSESALLAGVALSLGVAESSGGPVSDEGVLRPTPAPPAPPRPPRPPRGCDILNAAEWYPCLRCDLGYPVSF